MDFHIDNRDICIRGRLTFAQNGEFRRVVEALTEVEGEVVLDLAEVEFIDSAGLGMLLVARDTVLRGNGRLALRHAGGQVGRMLDLAKFGDFFAIHG
jgi:anti-anti-sigma factor